MTDNIIEHAKTSRWLYLFIAIHLLLWTLVPILVRYNLPLDSIEGTVWGHQLEWGYDKNPFLNGWLTALAIHLDGHTGYMVYCFSQISVVVCFWAVWRLANDIVAPAYALLSVLLLEGIQYYNFHSIDFNDNTLELSLWALTIYYFYQSLRQPTRSTWLLTGLFAGFGMMAKYYTAALLLPMFLLLSCDATHHKQLTTTAPYFGLCAFLAIILPHTVWLFYHDFITVTYVFERASSPPSWSNHFFYPAQFAWQQLQALLPALILFALLFLGSKPRLAVSQPPLSQFNKRFLYLIGFGPFLFTILLSLVLGIKLRAGWGMPLLSLWGIILVAHFPPRLSNIKLSAFVAGIFSLMGLLLSGYSISLMTASESSANFPGRQLAQIISQQWHNTYHTPLVFVGGSRWLCGNIEFYAKDHPAVFIEWDKRRAPWINTQEMQQKGAVFVWDMTGNETLPSNIQERFPQLHKPTVLELAWHRNKKNLPPLKIGVAFLPPQPSLS